ncbi:hepatic lectin-like protein [Dinothrombium tinctorium]|uniref:Hepatic lectin-like protein n=1 Tax=Dinothrombium tinctorium TaxID=1965070 RepID=A0A3S3SL47_9ACAR|nr:hepatic lectin-like protein [Dinothrombium tinctorium]
MSLGIVFFVLSTCLEIILSASCPPLWHGSEEKCYLINYTKATMEQNQELCHSLNASMLSIHSQTEFEFVKSLMNDSMLYWLGARKSEDDSKSFQWLDGSVFNFSLWHQGFPRSGKAHFCLGVAMNMDAWYEVYCNYNGYGQICQKSLHLINFNSSIQLNQITHNDYQSDVTLFDQELKAKHTKVDKTKTLKKSGHQNYEVVYNLKAKNFG